MSKLYVFGIGGTGSRVLKSLVMLLASGVECKMDIVPVIIDPDDSAADMTRTVEMMKKYKAIRNNKYLEFADANKNRFFKTELQSVDGMQDFIFSLENTHDGKFKDFIKMDQLDPSSKALVKMLFSEKNLESDMKVGFKGNPNIGSVVLNQFADSQEYKNFANGFADDGKDRVFIISSIFGGTGASGFPLLLKTIRNDKNSQKWKVISECKIGAVTVMPYFGVTQDDNSEVDSSTFISKTKSALAYYEKNISGNNSLDALYYIGDLVTASYENCEGGSGQRNDAHFIELCSALAVLDFANTPNEAFDGSTRHFEYGLKDDNNGNELTFKNLGEKTKKSIMVPLTQFVLMNRYLNYGFEKGGKSQPWAIDNQLDDNFFSGYFFEQVQSFHQDFHQWLKEMARNKRAFMPFDADKVNPLFEIVNGYKPKSSFLGKKNYDLFDSTLNSNWNGWNGAASREQKFMELFYRATEELVNEKYNM